jgi:hypothetical protein
MPDQEKPGTPKGGKGKDEKEPSKEKKGDGDEGGEEMPTIQLEPRGNWFEERVLNALKIKSDKWKKMLSATENM